MLWRAIDSDTKRSVAHHLGRLLDAIHRGREGSRTHSLAIIAAILDHAARSDPPLGFEVVTPFMEMLRGGTSEIISEIKALADYNLPEDIDEESLGVIFDATMADPSSNNTSDTTMADPSGSFSDTTMAYSSGNISDTNMASSSDSDSEASMERSSE